MSSIRPSVLKVGLLVALAAVAAFPVEAQGPPQGQVVIDMVRLNFMPNQGYKEIPADGVAGMGAMTSIYWSIQGGSPPSPLGTTVSWTVLAGGGEFDPPSKSVVFTSNPHGEPVAYKQPTTPSATDVTVHGCASAGNKMGEDSLVLRGISMLIERRGPEELYSGTSTLRATTTVYAIAVCPGNLSLRPSGKVYATVSGDGVYLKWDEGGATVYGKSRAVDVTWM